jgi:hypothetical protein
MPTLSEDVVINVMDVFTDIGVECLSDLNHIQEKDLVGVLKPIQVRKLLSAWKSGMMSFALKIVRILYIVYYILLTIY